MSNRASYLSVTLPLDPGHWIKQLNFINHESVICRLLRTMLFVEGFCEVEKAIAEINA
jgi:hypothetical protein